MSADVPADLRPGERVYELRRAAALAIVVTCCSRRPLFLLGTHQPGWLARARVPLFVSDRRLRVYKSLPRAAAPWALDSGGFTELQKYGGWTVTRPSTRPGSVGRLPSPDY